MIRLFQKHLFGTKLKTFRLSESEMQNGKTERVPRRLDYNRVSTLGKVINSIGGRILLTLFDFECELFVI